MFREIFLKFFRNPSRESFENFFRDSSEIPQRTRLDISQAIPPEVFRDKMSAERDIELLKKSVNGVGTELVWLPIPQNIYLFVTRDGKCHKCT